ncbi:MAG TPA: hypothetical protein QF646_02840, partial [Candidatus Poseidoniales archaeon]|nr:hypothetical protein [Candidatus Poseidoniales archaeon]
MPVAERGRGRSRALNMAVLLLLSTLGSLLTVQSAAATESRQCRFSNEHALVLPSSGCGCSAYAAAVDATDAPFLAGGSNDGTFTLSVWIKPVRDDVTMTVLDYNTPVGTNGWNRGLQAIGGGIFPQFSMGHATSRVLIGSTHQVPVGMWSQITV